MMRLSAECACPGKAVTPDLVLVADICHACLRYGQAGHQSWIAPAASVDANGQWACNERRSAGHAAVIPPIQGGTYPQS